MPGGRRLPAWLAALAVTGMLLGLAPSEGPAPAAPAAPRGPRAACTENPFTRGFAEYVAARWPGNRISAAVYDGATGCEYTFRPELRMTTASVIKVEIMAAVLLRAQREGRGLTQWEEDRIWPMITESANTPASELWWSLGGTSAMAAFERELGLTQTAAAGPTWGLTTTSAHDRNAVLRQVLLGEYGPLSASSRAIARSYMLQVVPSQRWGAPAGAPGGWAVPMKNGFYDSRCCNWRLNTSGVVERPDGSRYALTVLTDGWPSDRPGIEAVDFVSSVSNAATATPVGPFASSTQLVRRQYRDVLGRSPTFGEIHLGSQYVAHSDVRGADLTAELLKAPELQSSGRLVLRLYLGVLRRFPDGAIYRDRRDWLRSGRMSPLQQAQRLADAAELNGDGLTDAEFVDTVFRNALGRDPEPATRAHWISRLQAGVARGHLVLAFADSSEARRQTKVPVAVGATVLSMLGRPPTPDGLERWSDRIAGGEPLRMLTLTLLRRDEYRDRVD